MYFAHKDMNFGNQEQNTMFWILSLSKMHVNLIPIIIVFDDRTSKKLLDCESEYLINEINAFVKRSPF